jgi:nucleoside-diphosphate-sugar epimerase
MAKKILVTGGAGYIGSLLVRDLLLSGYSVRVFDKLVFSDNSLADVKDKIELVVGEIENPPPSLFRDVYAVIHLAAISTDATAYISPRKTDLVNHIATANLAKAAKENGVRRFVYASSCSVYFTYDTPEEPPYYKETDRVNPISSYALSKRAAEEALLELRDDGFEVIIFRKGTLYGYSQRMRFDLVINSFTKDAVISKRLKVNAGGKLWRPFFDVADAASLYQAAIKVPLPRDILPIFNLVSAHYDLASLATMVADYVGTLTGEKVAIDTNPSGVTRNYRADTTLFKKVFAYQPSRTIQDAVHEIWVKIKDGTIKDPTDPIYYNDKWYKG